MNTIKLMAVMLFFMGLPITSFAEEVAEQFIPSGMLSASASLEERQEQAMLFESYPETANVYLRVAKGSSWGSKWYAVGVKSSKEIIVSRFPAGQYIRGCPR